MADMQGRDAARPEGLVKAAESTPSVSVPPGLELHGERPVVAPYGDHGQYQVLIYRDAALLLDCDYLLGKHGAGSGAAGSRFGDIDSADKLVDLITRVTHNDIIAVNEPLVRLKNIAAGLNLQQTDGLARLLEIEAHPLGEPFVPGEQHLATGLDANGEEFRGLLSYEVVRPGSPDGTFPAIYQPVIRTDHQAPDTSTLNVVLGRVDLDSADADWLQPHTVKQILEDHGAVPGFIRAAFIIFPGTYAPAANGPASEQPDEVQPGEWTTGKRFWRTNALIKTVDTAELLKSPRYFFDAFSRFERGEPSALDQALPAELQPLARRWRTVEQARPDMHLELDDQGRRSLVAHLSVFGSTLQERISAGDIAPQDARLLTVAWLAHDARMPDAAVTNKKTGLTMYPDHPARAAADTGMWAQQYSLSEDDAELLRFVVAHHMEAHKGSEFAGSEKRLAVYRELPEHLRDRGLRLLGVFQAVDAASTLTPTGTARPVGEDTFLSDYEALRRQAAISAAAQAHANEISTGVRAILAALGRDNPEVLGQVMPKAKQFFSGRAFDAEEARKFLQSLGGDQPQPPAL